MQTSCVDCGAPVATSEGRGRPRKRCFACSPQQLGNGTHKKRPLITGRCAECGAMFVATNPAQKFCARKCANRANNRIAQERRVDRSPRVCRFCGAMFTPTYGDLRSIYCSNECRLRHAYRAKSGSTHRRRARQYGRQYESISKWVVFERDGWKCQICGRDTPRELSGAREPRSPELDHIVPLAAGGDHVIGNVQCACLACNRAKGAKLPAKGARHATGRI